MGNSPAHDADVDRPEHADSTKKDELSELRSLLLGPDRRQLKDLEERLEETAATTERISQVLPDAIRQRSDRDSELAEALTPTVEAIVDLSVSKNPKVLTNALSPVIGPAIRRSIAQTLRGLFQALNQVFEQSLSWQGLKWRAEALRSGRSFAEVVVLHSVVFRVEQVLLVHRESGLLLDHVMAADIGQRGSEMISDVLTAVQDFLRDSSPGQRQVSETIQVGDLTVWIEQGPHAVLAGIIRGRAPQELRIVFQDALQVIHLECGDLLGAFDGDASPFASVRHHLEECLLARYKEKKKTISPLVWFFVGFLFVCLIGWVYWGVRKHHQWTDYLELLRREPGIVVTSAEKRWGGYVLTGLRDPLAPDPDVLLQKKKIDPKKVQSRWDPYQALDPPLILARAKRLLDPPDTVSLTLEGGTLIVDGPVEEAWVREARGLARGIPGVLDFRVRDASEPVPRKESVATDGIETSKARIESQVLFFQFESNEIAPGQEEKVSTLVREIQELSELAKSTGAEFVVDVVGHTDPSGPEILNRILRKRRAEHVRSLLIARGVPPRVLNATGNESSRPSPQGEVPVSGTFERKVTFHVKWTQGESRKADS